MQMATTLIPKYQRKFKPISKPHNATLSAGDCLAADVRDRRSEDGSRQQSAATKPGQLGSDKRSCI